MKILILVIIYFTSLSALDSFSKIQAYAPSDTNKMNLGKRLFSDPLLSSDKEISCASCHQFSKSGVVNA